jgi:hypothetical protein
MKNGHKISDELYMAFFENKIGIPVDILIFTNVFTRDIINA